jgi:flagellar protein FlgJ
MSLATLTATSVGNVPSPAPSVQPDTAAIKKMAAEFESVLLNQMTAALNPKEEDEEDGLFTNSGGLGLSKQMFSEQMAKTMSEGGGIGLADLILSQVNAKKGIVKSRESVGAAAAAKDIRVAPALRFQPMKPLALAKPAGVDQYPDAIIVSEASTSFSPSLASPVAATAPAAPATVTAGDTSIATASDSASRSSVASAAHATRPRRVHPTSSAVASPNNISAPTGSTSVAFASENARPMIGSVSLQLPIRGEIRSVFGPRRDPINGRHRFHQGIDIAAVRGTPIGAAAAGQVIFAGKNKGYGNMVMIEHADGRRTLYGHAERLFVKTGDTVTAGETIAAVGSTGHSTGPHLHFEVREGGRAVNPFTILANHMTLARR